MLRQLGNIFKVPDLRKRILYTLMIITIHRIGAHIPIPFVDPVKVKGFMDSAGAGGGILNMIDMFSGGAFKSMTVFALGIMPYISASIILQLLMVVWPRLEKIAKEGEVGKRKINQYTRYGTVLLAAVQAFGIGYGMLLKGGGTGNLTMIPDHPVLFMFMAVLSVTTGTCFIMWLGEKITEKGIGNGISIIITLGILASYPGALILSVKKLVDGGPILPFVIYMSLFVVMCGVIITFQQASRKIPIQHARRVVGRRMTQGATQHLPLKINTAGVIPVIFSSAILSFPALIFGQFSGDGSGFIGKLSSIFAMQTVYNVYDLLGLSMGGLALVLKSINFYIFIYILLTGFFCYFYTAITFNPIDVAENLKKSGAFIPGRRPGKPTSDYINYVLTRITLVGAVYLCGVAVLPMVLTTSYGMDYILQDFVGGTGLIIVAGVLLDTLKQIESQLMVRHYEGFKRRRRGGG